MVILQRVEGFQALFSFAKITKRFMKEYAFTKRKEDKMTDKFEELTVGERQRCVRMVYIYMRLGVTDIDKLVERTHFPKAIVEACVECVKTAKETVDRVMRA